MADMTEAHREMARAMAPHFSRKPVADLSDIPDESVTAELEEYATTLLLEHARDVEYLTVHEMAEEHLGREITDEEAKAVHEMVVRAELTVTLHPEAAALSVLNTAKDSETFELLRTAVSEISQMRADWVNAYVDRAQRAWRGGSWRSTDADRVEREAIDKWNASHPGLIALWKSYQDRAAALRGGQ